MSYRNLSSLNAEYADQVKNLQWNVNRIIRYVKKKVNNSSTHNSKDNLISTKLKSRYTASAFYRCNASGGRTDNSKVKKIKRVIFNSFS